MVNKYSEIENNGEMKVKKFFCIFFAFVLSSICFAEQLNKNWIQKDIANFDEVLSFIEKEEFSHSSILNLMNKKIENEKLGFNLIKSDSKIPDGYLSIYISYIYYEDLPCELRISFYKDYFVKIEKELPGKQVRKLKKKFIFDGNYYVFSIKNDDNYQKYYEYKQKQIGDTCKLDLPFKYQEYYDYLTSPFNEFSYGYIIGIAPMVPDGRIAMEKLMELKDENIFINIIKSDNPVGRMYGMEGLLRLDNSSKNIDIVNEVFEKLIEDEISYKSQGGCIVSKEFYEKINSENISKYIYDFSFDYEVESESFLDFLLEL